MPVRKNKQPEMHGGEITEVSDCYNYKAPYSAISYVFIITLIAFIIAGAIILAKSGAFSKGIGAAFMLRNKGSVRPDIVMPLVVLGIITVAICTTIYGIHKGDVRTCLIDGVEDENVDSKAKSKALWTIVALLFTALIVAGVTGWLLIANSGGTK